MGAVPKVRISARRRKNRRSHWKLGRPSLIPCPHCQELRFPHHVCPHCGHYRDEDILEMEAGGE